MCNDAVHVEPGSLAFVPDHFKTEELCNEEVHRESCALDYIPDHFKIQEMCNEAMYNNPAVFLLIPDCFKIQEIYIKTVMVDPWRLYDVSDHFKTQEMCDDAVWGDSFSFQFVPNWFVTQQQLKIWHDDDDYCNDNEIIEWYEGHQNRKAQKTQIKKELIPIAWHPSRRWDWCVPEDEKN